MLWDRSYLSKLSEPGEYDPRSQLKRLLKLHEESFRPGWNFKPGFTNRPGNCTKGMKTSCRINISDQFLNDGFVHSAPFLSRLQLLLLHISVNKELNAVDKIITTWLYRLELSKPSHDSKMNENDPKPSEDIQNLPNITEIHPKLSKDCYRTRRYSKIYDNLLSFITPKKSLQSELRDF